MNNDKTCKDYKLIPPFINPKTYEVSFFCGSAQDIHFPSPSEFVLKATLEEIVESYQVVLEGAKKAKQWEQDNLLDLLKRKPNPYIAYLGKLKKPEQTSDAKSRVLFNLLFCLLFKEEVQSSQKLENLKQLVEIHPKIGDRADLKAYKNHTVAAVFDKTPYSSLVALFAAYRAFGKTKHLRLLELAVLCLNKDGKTSQDEIFSWIKYLHLEAGLPFDTKKENTQFVSRYSAAYKIVFELESAIKESNQRYLTKGKEWEKPLNKCLQANQECLAANRESIQSYVEDYFENSTQDEYSKDFSLGVPALIGKQFVQLLDTVRYSL